VILNASYNAVQAAAAAYMEANSQLTTTPVSTGLCYSPEAYDGASHSNIAQRSPALTSSYSITLYMDSSSLLSRRWVINWGTAAFGLWQTTHYGALRTFDVPLSNTPVNVTFVAYPPGGPSMLDRARTVWHFQRPGMSQSPTVTITRADGVQLPATVYMADASDGLMPAVGINITNKTAIVAGFRYQVRVVAGSDVFEWYPYFVERTAEQWSGQDPVLFKEQPKNPTQSLFDDKKPTPNDGSRAEKTAVIAAGAAIGGLVVLALIMGIVLLVKKKNSHESDDKEKNTTRSPIVNA
jgi:hypothetical protein